MWVRGLKLVELPLCILQVMVASYVGAWIETPETLIGRIALIVASYVGAWIETQLTVKSHSLPFPSHPMWVRGLKHNYFKFTR